MPQRNAAARLSTSRHVRSAAAACAALGAALAAACSADQSGGPLAPQASTLAASKASAPVHGKEPKDGEKLKDAKHRLSDGLLNVVRLGFHTDSADVEDGTDLPRVLTCGVRGQASRSMQVDGRGGVLRMGASSLTVPAGALTQAVTITATVTVDNQGPRVDFAPHGLRFRKPVEIVADYSGCSVPLGAALNVYYLNDGGGIVQVMPSADHRLRRQIRTITDHFSGYLVSWGRQ